MAYCITSSYNVYQINTINRTQSQLTSNINSKHTTFQLFACHKMAMDREAGIKLQSKRKSMPLSDATVPNEINVINNDQVVGVSRMSVGKGGQVGTY